MTNHEPRHPPADEEDDGRCPDCGEDEMDGGRCYYCGYHEYDCEMADCEKCSQPKHPPADKIVWGEG